LERVQDRQKLRLDKIDENEVDGRVVGDIGCPRGDERRHRVEGQWGVQRIVSHSGARLWQRVIGMSEIINKN